MKTPTVSKKNLYELILGSFSSHIGVPFAEQTIEDAKRASAHAKNVIEFMETTNLLHPDLQ
jgi:hypothetical protein